MGAATLNSSTLIKSFGATAWLLVAGRFPTGLESTVAAG